MEIINRHALWMELERRRKLHLINTKIARNIVNDGHAESTPNDKYSRVTALSLVVLKDGYDERSKCMRLSSFFFFFFNSFQPEIVPKNEDKQQ